MSEILAPVAFGGAQRLGVAMAAVIQPRAVIESVAFYHQRVSLPVTDRVSHPTRIGVRLQFAAVHEDLAVSHIRAEEDNDGWGLDNLAHPRGSASPVGDVRRTQGQTQMAHGVLAEDFQ